MGILAGAVRETKSRRPAGSGAAPERGGTLAQGQRLSPLNASSPAALELEADRAAEQVVGAPFAAAGRGAAQHASMPAPPSIQRKCSSCEEEDLSSVQRIAAPSEARPEAATPPAVAPGVLVDDGQPLGPGQMSRSAFMAAVRGEVTAMCNAELAAVGRSADGCPYLQRWLDFYDRQPAARIERAVVSYTGVQARDPGALLAAVVSRARGAVRMWMATGAVTGIPSVAPEPVSGAAGPAVMPGTGGAVQAKPLDAAPRPAVARSPAGIRAELGPGRPLDAGVRASMESGFRQGFDRVRIHTDDGAARLASSLSARALTVGQDVAFGAGEYRPGTLAGDLLIAHELAHTLQQRGGSEAVRPLSLDTDGALEGEADRAAAGAVFSGLGTLKRSPIAERGGLGLQGCTKKAKACPPGLSWHPASTVQWGSLGCSCLWRCISRPQAAAPTGPAYNCHPDSHCADPFERVGRDYTATGYGAAFTPLSGPPACGCFPLDIEGNQESSAQLVPVNLDMTNVVGPGADMAAGLRARQRGGGAAAQTDLTTGTRIPGRAPAPPRVVGGPVDVLRTRAITEGIYTPELSPRLERLFTEADPAIMVAMERTLSLPAHERGLRVQRLLSWVEGRSTVPETLTEGQTFGRGGTGSVAEVVGHPELASKTGAGRAASEAAAMVELELAGIPTVYLAERQVGDSPRLILRRIDGVGSKDIIGRKAQPPENLARAREYEQYVTQRTIDDLVAIRQRLEAAQLNVGDFQFILRRSDGAVFMNDPTGVTPNSKPSGTIENIIGRFQAILRRRTQGQ